MNKDKYKELIKLRDNFLDALNAQARLAKTEEDYNDLEDITEDVFNRMPIEVVQCDYMQRSTIKSYLFDDDQKDMNKLNKFMRLVWESDAIRINDCCVTDDLQYASDRFYGKED